MSVQFYGYNFGGTGVFHFAFMHSFQKLVSDFGDLETLCVRKDSHRESTKCKFMSVTDEWLTWLSLTWLRCTGLSVPLLSYGKSFSNQSYSRLDALPLHGVVLRCSWSDLSISAGPSTWSCRCEIIFVCLVWLSGVRHPGNMSKPSQLLFVDFLGNGLVNMKSNE